MTRRILAALAVVAAVLLPVAPANAGAWAVTELDTFPTTVKPGVTYTIGYWVLQHGTHPFEGPEADMRTGLRLTDGTKVLDFPGTALPERAHYAATMQVPEGTWKLEAMQGIFQPYNLGLLTVPGGLKAAPPAWEGQQQTGGTATDYWGDVKPPGFPWDAKTVVKAGATDVAPAPQPSPTPAAVVPVAPAASEEEGLPWGYAAGGLVVGAAAVFLVSRLRRREPAAPVEDEENTFVISRN
ncbi:hypothetical protein [Herbidospora sp. RD11066]